MPKTYVVRISGCVLWYTVRISGTKGKRNFPFLCQPVTVLLSSLYLQFICGIYTFTYLWHIYIYLFVAYIHLLICGIYTFTYLWHIYIYLFVAYIHLFICGIYGSFQPISPRVRPEGPQISFKFSPLVFIHEGSKFWKFQLQSFFQSIFIGI